MDELRDEVRAHRHPEYEVDPVFVNRWSPRSMTGETLDEDEFMPVFEAARWAPSSRNNQHWRFLYATRNSDHWEAFVDLLSSGNRRWATDAAVLVVIVSKDTFDDGGHARTHSFDTGAAWENLFLEGTQRGLAIHGIAGFDYDRARDVLDVPDGYTVEAMAAIGVKAPRDALPDDLREREVPSDRKPIEEITTEGRFEFDE